SAWMKIIRLTKSPGELFSEQFANRSLSRSRDAENNHDHIALSSERYREPDLNKRRVSSQPHRKTPCAPFARLRFESPAILQPQNRLKTSLVQRGSVRAKSQQ